MNAALGDVGGLNDTTCETGVVSPGCTSNRRKLGKAVNSGFTLNAIGITTLFAPATDGVTVTFAL
jgi:hypothetical protein